METNTANPLATAPIPQLLRKYSIPTTLTLLVNYLYNIVDQIFVGQGVGITGMAATNVAFPLTIVTIAVALMIGDGCAANLNLYLGRKDQESADRIISQTATLLLSAGVLLGLLGSLFARQIVLLFGATSTSFQAALAYTRVIILGLPFLMFSSALTAMIRADGNPKFAMKAMMLGAAINLVLDPILIFGFHMGVVGAGIATVIGEAASGILCLSRLKCLQTVRVRKKWLCPTPSVALQIFRLGFPSFLTQIMTAVVQVTMNNLMKQYGAAMPFGSDVALSVYGALMKVYQIAHAMFVGVSSATQPINSYNFGAKQFVRVQRTYKMASSIALVVSVGWFAVYQGIPRVIGSLFVTGDTVYLDACAFIFRLYMMGFLVYGLHMTTTSFFQSIGQPLKALALPVVRQAVVLIPLALFLAPRFGLAGALIAVPVADVASFFISLILVRHEFRKWRQQGWLDGEAAGQ